MQPEKGKGLVFRHLFAVGVSAAVEQKKMRTLCKDAKRNAICRYKFDYPNDWRFAMMHTSGDLFGVRDIFAVVPDGNPRENLVFVWCNDGAIHAYSAHENATITITADRIYSLQHLATSALICRLQSLCRLFGTRAG